MPEPKKIGRPKSLNPRIFYACRLPKATIDTIKAHAKSQGRSESDIIVMAFADVYIVGSTAFGEGRISGDKLGSRSIPATVIAGSQFLRTGAPLFKSNGKIL